MTFQSRLVPSSFEASDNTGMSIPSFDRGGFRSDGPHQHQPIRTAGASIESAKAALIMVHGRGASADNILTLVDAIDTAGFAYLAPQANGGTWYPNSFLAPIPTNEPGITSGLQAIDDVVSSVRAAGLSDKRIVLLGFCRARVCRSSMPRAKRDASVELRD